MEFGKDLVFVVSVVAVFTLVVTVNADGRTLLKLVLAAFLALTAVSYIVSVGETWIQAAKDSRKNGQQHDEHEIRAKHQEALRKSHEVHLSKATSYKERILIPRREEKLRRKEEAYQRTLDPAWRRPGHKLGGEGGGQTGQPCTTASDASRLRGNFIESVSVAPPGEPRSSHEAQPSKRKKVELPAEPDAGRDDCVVVMLRTPQGRLHQRRFLSTDTVQVLLNYMTSVGYHEKLYTLATSYPRQTLDSQSHTTLTNLPRRVTLNVEAREEPD